MQSIYGPFGPKLLSEFRGFALNSRQIITTTGTSSYTPPSGCKLILFECIGHGGNGPTTSSAGGTIGVCSGGGSGGYSATVMTPSASRVSFTLAIGTGPGSSGTSTVSLFDGVLFCGATGGASGANLASGSTAGFVVGGPGATTNSPSVAGDWQLSGQPGDPGIRVSGTVAMSGSGAPGPFGGGAAQGRITHGVGSSASSTAYGSGGSGALSANGAGTVASGNGAPGAIIIWEFF
jgi:hypothetical protein